MCSLARRAAVSAELLALPYELLARMAAEWRYLHWITGWS